MGLGGQLRAHAGRAARAVTGATVPGGRVPAAALGSGALSPGESKENDRPHLPVFANQEVGGFQAGDGFALRIRRDHADADQSLGRLREHEIGLAKSALSSCEANHKQGYVQVDQPPSGSSLSSKLA